MAASDITGTTNCGDIMNLLESSPMPDTMKNSRASGCALITVFLSASAALGQPPQSDLSLKRVVAIEYPWFARMAMLQGNVELVATISTQGTVTNIRVTSGPEPLTSAAKAALSKWQFRGCAAKQEGYELKFVVSFVLNGSCDAREYCPTNFEVDFPGKITVTAKGINAIVN